MKLSNTLDEYLALGTVTSPRGRTALRGAVSRLSDHLGRDAMIDDLRPSVVRSWLAARSEAACFSAVREDAKRLLTLWRWCAAQGGVEETFATPKHLMPAEFVKAKPPPVRTTKKPPKERKQAGSPHSKAPPRPDGGGWLSRLVG